MNDIPPYLAVPEEFEARDYPHALDEIRGREYYITQKHDGVAVVYAFIDSEFSIHLKDVSDRCRAGVAALCQAQQYDLANRLKDYYLGQKVALYGVINEKEELIVHGIYFINENMFATFIQLWTFCNEFGLDMANLVDNGDKFQYSVEDLEAMASKLKYKGKPTPGLVVRTQWPLRSTILGKDWSLKVTNTNYPKTT